MYKVNYEGLENYLQSFLEGEKTSCKIEEVPLKTLETILLKLNCHFDEDTLNMDEDNITVEFNFVWDRYEILGDVYTGQFLINKI